MKKVESHVIWTLGVIGRKSRIMWRILITHLSVCLMMHHYSVYVVYCIYEYCVGCEVPEVVSLACVWVCVC